MKYTTRMIGTVVAFCMAVPVFAQQYKATIPYRMVGCLLYTSDAADE